MKLSNLLSSKSGKRILNFAYCWGACVVIAGALCKIVGTNHADIVLYVGLVVEVIIFFLAGFEKPEEEYKWDKVYPQLREDENSKSPLQQMDKINESYAAQMAGMLAEIETMTKQLNTLNKHYTRMVDAVENKNNK